MGPKKGREIGDDENYWKTCIEEAPLDDEFWKVKVILIEPAGSDQDRIYLEKFEAYAAEERRCIIKNICKTETIFMVNQLGGEKRFKDDNLRIFEEGQAYLKEKRDIPPEILALIIKHLILKMKTEYLLIKQQRLEVREGMKRESTTMITKAEVRGTVNSVKPPEPPEVAPPKGKKGEVEAAQKPFEVDENKKYSTLLRVRGEEWRDKIYIDDYPTDGPNLYVAVTGFVEPYLAEWLIKIGIPLTAVVQIRIDPTKTTIPFSLFKTSKRAQSQTDRLAEKSLKFWEELQLLRINADSADNFKSTAFVVFTPPYWNNDNLSGNPEKIYDELCYLMYDIQDLSRQHVHYLENMNIISIPEELKDKQYLNLYTKHIDGIPLESVTSYLVLDSILQTVTESQHFDEKSSMSSLSAAATTNQTFPNIKEEDKLFQSETLVKRFVEELCQIDSCKKKYRLSYGDEHESHKNPIVIKYGDICKYNTFHLGNINLDNIVWKMLLGIPTNKLWVNRDKPMGEMEAKINFHVNVLLSCFDRTDVETAELTRLIHILACRKIYNNRSSLRREHLFPSTISEFKKTYLKRSVLAEPLTQSHAYTCASSTSPASTLKSVELSNRSVNDEEDEVSRIKVLFDCPDLSELVSAAEIANGKPISHMIDDFEYFEDFTGIGAFQIILDAFNKFNCVNYKYCEVTDCFIMMFFNSHDPDGIAREEWRCHLPTPLCLQDFFDFVLEEHDDWIKNEEKMYDENIELRSQSECQDSKGPLATKSCLDETVVKMELLMEGSLKHEEIINIGPETSESKIFSSIKASPISVDSKSSKKTKSPVTAIPKIIDPSLEESKVEIQEKPFSGYDLGERRVEVFGKDCSYFSKDGTRISTFYSLIIPMNLEYVILNIVPGNCQNEFWMHKAIGEFINPDIIDTCESFRIQTKDQVIIYIKKQIYQIPIPFAHISSGIIKCKENTAKPPSPDVSNISPQIFESRSYHSLFITWPNGLITESVYENNSPNISHIKQYYLERPSHLDEEMRCISMNGEVIIFKCNGNINIFQPDASCVNVTKYEKKIISDEVLKDNVSVVNSDKSKKGKGKDKATKTSSKSSNNALTDMEKEVDTKSLEYKLFIEEFEIIESNGLKQKWIHDSHFEVEKLMIRTATDYFLGEIFSKRMDGTNVLLNKDGVQLVTFPDNTRILTRFIIEDQEIFPEWTEEEIEYLSMFANDIDTNALKSKGCLSQNSNSETSSKFGKVRSEQIGNGEQRTDGYISVYIIYTIEHPNFTTITIDKGKGKFTIESPNNTCVTFDNNNHYDFLLDNRTSAKFNGEKLQINYEACSECKSFASCEVKIKSEEISSVTQIQRTWLKIEDSFRKKVTVNEDGNINVINETCSDQISSEESIYSKIVESSTTSYGKCNHMNEAKSLKFFVLRRDLTCSELVHRDILEQYKQACSWQPWYSINQYDTFGDHRTLWSILSPVHLNESEKWLMESKLSDKPKYLTQKDLKKDSGKGFYHWMRPYQSFQPKSIKPDNVLPERLPRAFILRTLEQQWRDAKREELKGAKELLNAIFRYRRVMESDCETILHVPILDPRSKDERRAEEIVQAIAHRVYEGLTIRLAENVQTRAKPNITTKPLSPSIQGELDEEIEERYEVDKFEEDIVSALKELDSVVKMSPALQRYWRRRAEELKEEHFYRYLLREGSVPPYFRNVLGGAIWWEIDKAAENAVTNAERRKIMCVCNEGDPSGH